MVVDGIQVVYDTVNSINPEQFTIAISKYDDAYMAQQFIEYFKLLSKNATIPKLMEEMKVCSNRPKIDPDKESICHNHLFIGLFTTHIQTLTNHSQKSSKYFLRIL